MKRIAIFLLVACMSGTVLSQDNKTDSLLYIATTSPDDTARFEAYLGLGRLFLNNNNDTAIYFNGQALIEANTIGGRVGLMRQAEAKSILGACYFFKSNFTPALSNFNDALSLIENGNLRSEPALKAKVDQVSASSLYHIGNVHRFQANYTTALEYYFKSLELYQTIGDKHGIGTVLGSIGSAYYHLSDLATSLDYCFKALSIYEELGNEQGQASNLYTIGSTYYNLLDYPKALEYYDKAMTIYERTGNKRSQASILGAVGNILTAKADYSKAIEHYRKALKINEEIGFRPNQAVELLHIGNIYDTEGKYSEALDYYFKAQKICEEIGMKSFLAYSYSNIGTTYRKIKDYSQAEIYLNKSLALNLEIKSVEQLLISYRELAILYKDMEKYDLALNYYKEQISMRDSMNNNENKKAAVQKEMQYEFDKKQDSVKLDNQRRELALQKELALKALQYEYDKKRAAIKSEQERQRLRYEQNLKQQQIEAQYAQKAVLLEIEQSKKEAENVAAMALAQAEIKRKIQERNFVLGSSMLLLGLLGFIVYGYFQKQKSNTILEAQKEEINRKSQALEQSLTKLTATQNQLIQKEKLANLGELTAGISHEIQNPLNFVTNFSELSVDLVKDLKAEIQNPVLDKDYINELFNDLEANQEKIKHHGKRASSIVKGMLNHSRTSTGVKEWTDINKLADEYLRLSFHGLRARDKSFNADFETHFQDTLPKIEIVPQDFGRVLLNLINNAFYAVNQKKANTSDLSYKPKVTVYTEIKDKHIIIRVRDNGTGMPDGVKGKIFQPFFTTKPTGEGTGLGLSLSYEIVTKGHGGTLTVESTEGTGTEFTICIPT